MRRAHIHTARATQWKHPNRGSLHIRSSIVRSKANCAVHLPVFLYAYAWTTVALALQGIRRRPIKSITMNLWNIYSLTKWLTYSACRNVRRPPFFHSSIWRSPARLCCAPPVFLVFSCIAWEDSSIFPFPSAPPSHIFFFSLHLYLSPLCSSPCRHSLPSLAIDFVSIQRPAFIGLVLLSLRSSCTPGWRHSCANCRPPCIAQFIVSAV